jgi:Mn-dependent DtxR family transcriptional regulator
MLGVQRSSVSLVASVLKADGLITYKRGLIEIRDRAGLEKRSCECYATNKHFRHLIETQRPRCDVGAVYGAAFTRLCRRRISCVYQVRDGHDHLRRSKGFEIMMLWVTP